MNWIHSVYALAGAASISYGLWTIHPAAMYVFSGAYMIVDAWRLANVQPPK